MSRERIAVLIPEVCECIHRVYASSIGLGCVLILAVAKCPGHRMNVGIAGVRILRTLDEVDRHSEARQIEGVSDTQPRISRTQICFDEVNHGIRFPGGVYEVGWRVPRVP